MSKPPTRMNVTDTIPYVVVIFLAGMLVGVLLMMEAEGRAAAHRAFNETLQQEFSSPRG